MVATWQQMGWLLKATERKDPSRSSFQRSWEYNNVRGWEDGTTLHISKPIEHRDQRRSPVPQQV